MFDAIQLEQSLIDIYETGLKDDTISTLYNANKEVHMAVRTSYGLTDRQTVESTVLQGDTWASLLASVQVDSIVRESENVGLFYSYKDSLSISNLGLVDDILGVTEAGCKAQMMNSFINIKRSKNLFNLEQKSAKLCLWEKEISQI